jgi:hypothetical protein
MRYLFGSQQGDRNAAPVEPVRGFGMNRKQKLARLAAVVAVLSAFALPCAGWGWDGAQNTGSDDAPAVAQAG